MTTIERQIWAAAFAQAHHAALSDAQGSQTFPENYVQDVAFSFAEEADSAVVCYRKAMSDPHADFLLKGREP